MAVSAVGISNKEVLSVFTSVPGGNDPSVLAFSFQNHLKQRFALFLKNLEEALQLDLQPLTSKVESLDPSQRFSCVFFEVYTLVREAYRTRDMQNIFDSLQALKNIEDEKYYCPSRSYSTILSEPWESVFINDMRSARHMDAAGHTTLGPTQLLPLFHWKEKDFPPIELKAAEKLMQDADPAVYRELEVYVSHIKLYMGKSLESFTSPRFFGAVYLRLPRPTENPVLYYLNTLVHEVSHLQLFAMMGEDLLVLNEESERFTSPLREDKRPMIGIFHATFVLARMVRVMRRVIQTKLTLTEAALNDAIEMLEKMESQFFEGKEVMAAHARLTERGRAIFESLEDCIFG